MGLCFYYLEKTTGRQFQDTLRLLISWQFWEVEGKSGQSLVTSGYLAKANVRRCKILITQSISVLLQRDSLCTAVFHNRETWPVWTTWPSGSPSASGRGYVFHLKTETSRVKRQAKVSPLVLLERGTNNELGRGARCNYVYKDGHQTNLFVCTVMRGSTKSARRRIIRQDELSTPLHLERRTEGLHQTNKTAHA